MEGVLQVCVSFPLPGYLPQRKAADAGELFYCWCSRVNLNLLAYEITKHFGGEYDFIDCTRKLIT